MTRTRSIPALLVVGLLLTGCGGDGDGGGDDPASAPTDASQADFCDAIVNSPDDLSDDDPEVAADAAHDYAEQLREIGTPEGTSDEARKGFEVYVDFLADVDADRISELKDSDAGFEDVFEGDDLEAFEALTEVTADCGPGEVETE